jgi:hypothetical protein
MSPVTPTIGSKEGELGPYRPWSRADFMKRLESYKVSTWFDKPEALSPVVCARWGWINEQTDQLHCTTCQARLIIDLSQSMPGTSDLGEQMTVCSHASILYSLK